MRLVGGRSLLIDGPSATLLPETKCFKYQLLDLFDVFEDSSFWFIVLKSGGENQTPFFFYHRGSSNFSTLNLTEFQWWLESKQKIIPFGYYSLCGTWFFEDSLKTQMGEVLIFQSSQGPTRCEFFMVLRGGGEWNLREIPYLFAILEDCRETFPRVNKKKGLFLFSLISIFFLLTELWKIVVAGSEESASSPVVPRSGSSARKKKYAPNDQGRYVCTQCNRSYAAYHNLMRHMRYECGLPPRFPCNVCGRFFRRKDDLQRHIARIHGMLDVSLDGVKPDE